MFVSTLLASLFLYLSANSEDLPVDDETCLDCHDEYELSVAESPHRLSSESYQPIVLIGCASCHEGAEVHIEDPSTENITNPAQLMGHEAGRTCRQCHQPHQELDNHGFDSHSNLELNCASCHRIHGFSRALLLDDRAGFCLECHSEMRAKFSRRSSHPVLQDNVTCLSCHLFTRRADHNVVYGLDRICRDCHPEQGGPFLHEHSATQTYEVGGSGCVECHDPHGSENDRLLKQPGNNLCRSCHVEHVTRNHNNLWDKVWSREPCQTCHIDTHGSFVSALYLDPDLPAKLGGDCYNPGCHSLNGQGGNR
jgi:DmsE family decaheme c-type cytochrome